MFEYLSSEQENFLINIVLYVIIIQLLLSLHNNDSIKLGRRGK